jgi:predicted nuclease of predicted toxin-antitoxin system
VKFLADHCLSLRTVNYLREAGHTITTLKQFNKHQLADPDVLSLAIERNEILITEDKGFGNIFDYPLHSHKGIIVIITKTRKREMLHITIEKFLLEAAFEEITGKLIIIEDNLIRIRQLNNEN